MIVSLLFWLFVFGLVILVLVLGAMWGMNKAASKLVGEKHRDLEIVVTTGQVPERWRARYEAKMACLAQDPTAPEKLAALQERANSSYLTRLDALADYVQRSTLVDGEDTRREILAIIARVREGWMTGENLPGEQ